MNRAFSWTKILLTVGLAISGAALLQEAVGSCGACEVRGPIPIALVGTLIYGVLLTGALVFGPTPHLFVGIVVVAATHGALVGGMAASGVYCSLCLLAATNGLALLLLNFACDSRNYLRAALVLPVAGAVASMALFVTGSIGTTLPPVDFERSELTPVASNPSEGVEVIVFEKADCFFCEELRATVIPRLQQEFAGLVHVTYREASEMPGIRRTPTLIVIAPGKSHGRTIEGLPPYGMLRRTVVTGLAGGGN